MPVFQLVSDKKPAGSQPEAIKKLSEGYSKHDRQTLLGITGFGKSLRGDEQLLLRSPSGKIVKTTIGDFVNRKLTAPSMTGNTLYQATSGYRVLSFDPVTGNVEEGEITQVSKHEENTLYEITLDDNSSISVTADHNCFRFKGGGFELCETRELSVGDALPLVTIIPEPANPITVVSLRQANPQYEVIGNGQMLQVQRGTDVPVAIPITQQFLTFCGLYVAEGHSRDSIVLLSNENTALQENCQEWLSSLNLNWTRRNKNDVCYYSAPIARLMRQFGSHSGRKKMPGWVFNLSNKDLGVLLRAAFDGDGWVEPANICYLSKSKQLISDIRYLLLRYGITTRVIRKEVNGTEFWQIHIMGQQNIQRFKENIGFSLLYKQEKLEKAIKETSNTNVDLIPDSGAIVKHLRWVFGLNQKAMAAVIGCQPSYISLIESGERNLSRHLFERLAHWAIGKDVCYSYLLNFTKFNFRKIKSVQKVPCEEGFVYDIAVKDTNTFMAGFGGIFVHNTFVIANVIQNVGKPTLVIAHNKTLAAQLYAEMKELFPHNRVEYFVSYFDYYQPESYLPSTDTYIEKDSRVNPNIERMRLQAMTALLSRKDVIVVASISCIYGLSNPADYKQLSVDIEVGQEISREKLLRKLVDMQYERNDQVLESGKFRVRGDTIDLFPAYDQHIIRIELFGDEIEKITQLDALNFTAVNDHKKYTVFPAKQFVTTDERIDQAMSDIYGELEDTLPKLDLLERTRLEKRTRYDLQLIKEIGYCNGIENYSRHFDRRKPGEPPYTLLDYFPDDFLFVIDESHQTIPQMHGMYKGDMSRKTNLVEHGFRLPCAYDNRPLKFEEVEAKYFNKVIFVSATPAEYERKTSGQLVEGVIRPTGLIDPEVEVRPSKGQITDIINEIKATTKRGWRTLVTTLTKKMAEDLTDYLAKEQIKVRYLHSEIDTLERTEIIRELRLGTFDVLVGINLLREGLDIPETALVCILDADKEGFLRNETSLLQTIGRAARNSEGRVIFYADRMTAGMQLAITKTAERRKMQIEHNKKHGITPKTIIKAVPEKKVDIKSTKHIARSDIPNVIIQLEAEMGAAAANLDFEEAIRIRDKIKELEKQLGQEVHVVSED